MADLLMSRYGFADEYEEEAKEKRKAQGGLDQYHPKAGVTVLNQVTHKCQSMRKQMQTTDSVFLQAAADAEMWLQRAENEVTEEENPVADQEVDRWLDMEEANPSAGQETEADTSDDLEDGRDGLLSFLQTHEEPRRVLDGVHDVDSYVRAVSLLELGQEWSSHELGLRPRSQGNGVDDSVDDEFISMLELGEGTGWFNPRQLMDVMQKILWLQMDIKDLVEVIKARITKVDPDSPH